MNASKFILLVCMIFFYGNCRAFIEHHIFSQEAAYLLIQKQLVARYKNDIVRLKTQQGLFSDFSQKQKVIALEKKLNSCIKLEQYVLWHLKDPSIGLLNDASLNHDNLIYYQFSLHELAPLKGKGITIGLLDVGNIDYIGQIIPVFKLWTSSLKEHNKKSNVSYHALHNISLIKGSSVFKDQLSLIPGIAPNSDIIFISLSDNNLQGGSWYTIAKGLQEVLTHKVDLLSISLEWSGSASKELSDHINRLLSIIPYVVAAAGNNNMEESYPASYEAIPFDVGAFSFDCTINKLSPSLFSNYTFNKGPKFLAPGEKIFGCIGLNKDKPQFMFMDGTSSAVPLITGFVALMLAEFQKNFSREELLTVCYYSLKIPDTNYEWQKRSVGGIFDMRHTLFTLHCIREIKKRQLLQDKSFYDLLLMVHTFLHKPVKSTFKNLNDAIKYVADHILSIDNVHEKILHPSFERVFTLSRQSSRLFLNDPHSFLNRSKDTKKSFSTAYLQQFWRSEVSVARVRSK